MKSETEIFFPPEWAEQDAVMLTWPHAGSDWAPMLAEVEKTYLEIAREICKRELLIVVCPDPKALEGYFSREELQNIRFFAIPSNDTWARDHAPIGVFANRKPLLLDFQFNGWGNKFNARLDNQISGELFRQKAFKPQVEYAACLNFILEGGSLETDGKGTLLTTSECLLNPNRNPGYSKGQIEKKLSEMLGVNRFLWLDYGFLQGDDTDSHIDTLARLCDENTIAYVKCDNPDDPHFRELNKMEEQLRQFVTPAGEPYRLMPLPMPDPVFSADEERLPATYANFLVINQAVLVPVYAQKSDKIALKALQNAFPDREIIGINCLSLIKQNGSLHCITMQFPKGFIR